MPDTLSHKTRVKKAVFRPHNQNAWIITIDEGADHIRIYDKQLKCQMDKKYEDVFKPSQDNHVTYPVMILDIAYNERSDEIGAVM